MDNSSKTEAHMSNGKDQKPTPMAGAASADTTIERKLLALKKAVKDLFTSTAPNHIGVDHYKIGGSNFFTDAFVGIYKMVVEDVKNRIHGLSTDGIESQLPTIDKLGYGNNLVEGTDRQQTEHNIIKDSAKLQPIKTERSHSMWEALTKEGQPIFNKVENFFFDSESSSHDAVSSPIPHGVKPNPVKEK